jgi:ATP-dependent 26S proteasome regulatory subunit
MFSNYVKAGYSILYVQSHEELRVLTEYVAQTGKLKVQDGEEPYKAFSWDVADGIRPLVIKSGALASGLPIENTANDPLAPLKWLDEIAKENSVLFLKDYRAYLQKDFQDSTFLIRKIRNLLGKFKSKGKVLVIISPEVQIPQELDKEINVINFALPNREELTIVLRAACEAAGTEYPKNDEELISAALGLTSTEADNAFSISLVESHGFDPKVVRREKSAVVKKTGLLQVVESQLTMENVGGLDNLKEWLQLRKNCFSKKAREFGITPPKGMVLAGISGTGKSLSAKAVATLFGRPLLRFDMGRIMGGIVGESEGNMRKCLSIASAVAPCILWIDEIEKGLAGVKAGGRGQEAHEVTKRVFGELLNFMQDREADVLLIATCNSLEALPPELLRGGRIDCIFWVDLPDDAQREEIIKIHLKHRGRKPDLFGKDIVPLVKASEGFTGAEIEVWVQESLIRAFNAGQDEVRLEDFLMTVSEITPISKLMKAEIDASRAEAKARGTKPASKPKAVPMDARTEGVRKVKLI